jgi:AcrR family transcriptional regulator
MSEALLAVEPRYASRTKLLHATLHVIGAKRYAVTTVDNICNKAAVTKGRFFRYFKSNDELALAATSYWGTMTDGFFAAAPSRKLEDLLDRLLGCVDFRAAILEGEPPDYPCLFGTLVQETYATQSDIRVASERGLSSPITELTRYRSRQETVRTDSDAERGKPWLLYSSGASGLIHLGEGPAKSQGRARKP